MALTTDTPTWTVDDAPIICSEPIDALIEDLQRRHHERAEEMPGSQPKVSLSWVLDRLADARNKAVKLDRWMTIAQITGIVNDVCPRTVRRWMEDVDDDRRRTNSISGKIEVHIEAVAESLDMTVEEVREERARLEEAA